MICKNCGGKVNFIDGHAVCSSCGNKYQLNTTFEDTEVFICYVENDSNGRRTKESIVANDIYQKLTNAKIKTFYQRVSASDLFEDDFEQAVYQGIYNSKIILIVGANTENFELLLKENKEYFGDKKILPVYSDMNAYDIPSELSKYQALNYDSIGASSDLVKNTLTLLGRQDEIDTEELSNKTAKKRRNRLIIIIAGILALCIGIGSYIVFGTPYVLTSKKYEYAMQLYEQEKYIDALNMFLKLEGYENSNNLINSIYSKYDGYYQTKDKSLSLYIDIKDKTSADVEIKKNFSNKKIVSFNVSAKVSVSTISMNFTDSETNHGNAKIELKNEGLSLTTKTKIQRSDLSIGENKIEFKLKDKSDKPIVKEITQKILKKWLSKKKTTIADFKQTGYEIEFLNEGYYGGSHDDGFRYAIPQEGTSVYNIKNTDVNIFALDFKPSSSDDYNYDDIEKFDEPIVYAISAPAQMICPDLVGKDPLAYSEEDIAYVPVGKFFPKATFHGNYHSIGFGIYIEEIPEKIENSTIICVTSKFWIDQEMFESVIGNAQVRLLEIKLEKMYKNEHNINDNEVYVSHEASSDDNFLFSVSEDNNENVYAFYKANRNTGEIEFIVELEYDEFYYYYDDIYYWKDYPEYFKEFMTDDEYKAVTTCSSCGETIKNPRDYDGECEDCYNGDNYDDYYDDENDYYDEDYDGDDYYDDEDDYYDEDYDGDDYYDDEDDYYDDEDDYYDDEDYYSEDEY